MLDWDGEFVSVVRRILSNEKNLRTVQRQILLPILDTCDRYQNVNEERIIMRIAKEFERRGPISVELEVLKWQRFLLEKIGIKPALPVNLEVALTRIHKLHFARGPNDIAEFGDFILHVEYVAPNRYSGLSNFFQMKRITNSNARAEIDVGQIRFWACPQPMRYWRWDQTEAVDPSDFDRWGEWSHYWFVHSSSKANTALASALLENSRIWTPFEPLPIVQDFHYLFIFPPYHPLWGVSSGVVQEIRSLFLTSSFLFSSTVVSLLRNAGLTDLCSRNVSELKPKKVPLLSSKNQPTGPIQPGGVRITDCMLLRHGIDRRLIRKMIELGEGRGPEVRAKKSGLALVVRVRAGGGEARDEREFKSTG